MFPPEQPKDGAEGRAGPKTTGEEEPSRTGEGGSSGATIGADSNREEQREGGQKVSTSGDGTTMTGVSSNALRVDLAYVFNAGSIITYNNQNDSTTHELLDRTSGDVSVAACFSRFTLTAPIQTDNALTQTLQKKDQPFSKNGGTADVSFLSFFWDVTLETQFDVDQTPTDTINKLLWSLVPENETLRHDVGEDIMQKYSEWVNNAEPDSKVSNRIPKFCGSNWYDVPGVMKVLAPSHGNLVKTDYNSIRFYTQNAMKCLPHSIIMLPWTVFGLNSAGLEAIPTRKMVRKIVDIFVLFEMSF